MKKTSPTFDQCAEWYLSEHIERVSPNPGHTRWLLGRVLPELVGKRVDHIDQGTFLKMWDDSDIPASVRRNAWLSVVASVRWAAKTGRARNVPALFVPAVPTTKRRSMTATEVQKLLDDLPHWGATMRLWFLLSWFTAQRIGAIIELTWDRVDWQSGTIDFNAKFDGKRRKARAISPMSPSLRELMRKAHDTRSSNHVLELEHIAKPQDYIRRQFRARLEKLGLDPKLSPHFIRHTVATIIAQKDVRQAQKLLGHQSLATTERTYAHLEPSFIKPAMDILDTIAGGSR